MKEWGVPDGDCRRSVSDGGSKATDLMPELAKVAGLPKWK